MIEDRGGGICRGESRRRDRRHEIILGRLGAVLGSLWDRLRPPWRPSDRTRKRFWSSKQWARAPAHTDVVEAAAPGPPGRRGRPFEGLGSAWLGMVWLGLVRPGLIHSCFSRKSATVPRGTSWSVLRSLDPSLLEPSVLNAEVSSKGPDPKFTDLTGRAACLLGSRSVPP